MKHWRKKISTRNSIFKQYTIYRLPNIPPYFSLSSGRRLSPPCIGIGIEVAVSSFLVVDQLQLIRLLALARYATARNAAFIV